MAVSFLKAVPTLIGIAVSAWLFLRLILGVVHPDGRPALCADILTGLDALEWLARTLVSIALTAIKRAMRREEVLEWALSRLIWTTRELVVSVRAQRTAVRRAIEQGRTRIGAQAA